MPRPARKRPVSRLPHRDRNRAVAAAFVEPVGQQPAGVQPFLEEIDRPGEMHLAVDPGEVFRVAVGAFERMIRLGGDETVEVGEFRIGRTAAQDHLETTLHATGKCSEQPERLAAAKRAEPADLPGLPAGSSAGDGRAHRRPAEFKNLVLQQHDRRIDLAERRKYSRRKPANWSAEGGPRGQASLSALRIALRRHPREQQAMDVEAFIDDRHIAGEQRVWPGLLGPAFRDCGL